jgi:hypothetical protein
MKKIFTILAICVAFASYSQTKDKAKPKEMSKESLSKVKSYYELLEGSEKDVKIIATEIAGKCNGKAMIAETTSAELDSSALFIFKHVDVGSKLFIDQRKSDKSGKIINTATAIKVVK